MSKVIFSALLFLLFGGGGTVSNVCFFIQLRIMFQLQDRLICPKRLGLFVLKDLAYFLYGLFYKKLYCYVEESLLENAITAQYAVPPCYFHLIWHTRKMTRILKRINYCLLDIINFKNLKILNFDFYVFKDSNHLLK